jgi:K+-sensing histidine kinase KdpD
MASDKEHKSRIASAGARGWVVAVVGIGLATVILYPLSPTRVNPTTVALTLLLVVLSSALRYGSGPAIAASVVGMLCFNYFFLPPAGTFTIADPLNWIALFAFLVTAITVGELSARAKRRAEEAEIGRREIERLYEELREAFDQASQAEALRRSEQLKSALLDAITHDLRTPLTAIKVSATSMLDELSAETPFGPDLEGQREMLEIIDEEADRLNRFIDGLVELARIEAGAMKLRQRWVNIEDVITAALERALPRIRHHHITVSIAPELPVVLADAGSLAEAIYTLVENAAKYSPAGSEIRIAARSVSPDEIEVSVEDEGCGVPPELRERVFEKFFRVADQDKIGAPAAVTNTAAGLGMGLAIARGIIDAHRGAIRIEDKANGRGARFVVAIPIGDD